MSLPCKHALCVPCYESMSAIPAERWQTYCILCRTRIESFQFVGLSCPPRDVEDLVPVSSQGHSVEIPKLDALSTLLSGLVATSGDSPGLRGAVVFCECSDAQMVKMRRALAAACGLEVRTILSSDTPAKRDRLLAWCGSHQGPVVLIVRYRMCALGLNFDFADHCVLFNMPDRADHLHQAVGRLVRMSQASLCVYVWPVLFRDSIEERVWEAWSPSILGQHNHRAPSLAKIVSLER
jgi:hypothetical protein